MTLLHFGLFKPHEPQQALRNALSEVCDEYHEFSFYNNPEQARVNFHKLMSKHKPDVVFMQIQSGGIIKASTLQRYLDVKFFNFSGDVVEQFPSWYYELAPYCTTLFTNMEWVKLMEEKGFKARYFQIGFDHNIYKPEGVKAETKPVVFMGNNHGSAFPLSKLRGDMVNRFKSKDWFQVYGRGWGPEVIDLNHKQQQEAAVYRGAKIGINLSHMDLGSYTSDRMFRLMGSGAMCLAYRHKDIEKEFTEGINIWCWETLDQLEDMIETILTYPYPEIPEAGCKLVHEKYTWQARIKADLIPLL